MTDKMHKCIFTFGKVMAILSLVGSLTWFMYWILAERDIVNAENITKIEQRQYDIQSDIADIKISVSRIDGTMDALKESNSRLYDTMRRIEEKLESDMSMLPLRALI